MVQCLFNESLNCHQPKMQNGYEHSLLGWWKKYCSVYYNWRFPQRPNTANLKQEILNAIKDMDMGKFLHLGMDGPRRNWPPSCQYGFQKALDIGSCSLHILHGAFQTGMILPVWDRGKILKILYKIFDESPACCNVYLHEGTSKVFAMKVCSIRRIENQPVADWALEVWPFVVSTVKHILAFSRVIVYFFHSCLMKLVWSFIVWCGWFTRKKSWQCYQFQKSDDQGISLQSKQPTWRIPFWFRGCH